MKYTFVGALVVSACSFGATAALAQTCPTPLQHPEPNDATGWANAINGCLPQAVPSQVVGLGTFEAAPPPYRGMFWDPALVPCVVVGPRGGFDRWCVPDGFPVPSVRINSFNVQYEIAIRNKPANYDLQVQLTTPGLQGATTYPGTLNADGDLVTIPFHPDIIGTQVLKFLHDGEEIGSYEIETTLQPQLGAFVVPYLPVAIVYQPPGAESHATYTLGSSLGTRMCWGTTGASSTIETEDASLFFGKKSELVGYVAKAAGVVGLIPAVSWVGTVGKALDALDGLYHTQSLGEVTETEGRTLCRGSEVSVSVGQATEPGHGDLYLLRRDALFAYVVVLKDPLSGNTVATDGVPTVVLTLVHSEAAPAVYLDDLERDYPPDVVGAFTQLDLQMNPLLLKKQLPGTIPDADIGGLLRRARLKRLPASAATQYCRPDSTTIVEWDASFYTETDMAQATTKTTTTHVTGVIASILGEADQSSVSITLASNQANWEQYEQGSRIDLRCPEIHPPYQTWKMDIYLDKVFGTLLAVPGEKFTTTDPPHIAGLVVDTRGRPLGDRDVTLNFAGHSFRVRTGADGSFAFHVPSTPRAEATIVVGRQSFRVSYRGRPITDLRLRLTRP